MALEALSSRIAIKVALVWFLFVIIFYTFLSGGLKTPSTTAPLGKSVDGIVYIALGAMGDDNMVDYSIGSVRKLGKWRGDIYVITDSPQCFNDAVEKYEVKLVQVPKVNSIIEIKSLKTKLLTLLPTTVSQILYIDVDILVTRSLIPFFNDLNNMLIAHEQQNSPRVKPLRLVGSGNHSKSMSSSGNNTHTAASAHRLVTSSFDFAAFPDAKGHYVGFCSGCEKWHTGVMWFKRGAGDQCLKSWDTVLLSGKYGTDQQSLDEAELTLGDCPNALTMPAKHLLFAKDYIGMFLTGGQTFIHVTAAGRKDEQDYFYREWIIPLIRNSLHPPLHPDILNNRKQCELSQK